MQNKFLEFLDTHRDIRSIEISITGHSIEYYEVTMRSAFSSAVARYAVPIIEGLDIEGLLLNLYHMIREEEVTHKNDHH